MKDPRWSVYGLSLATTAGVVYISCAIFDALFPPYGLIRWLARASPWPIGGSVMGFITGLVMFIVAVSYSARCMESRGGSGVSG